MDNELIVNEKERKKEKRKLYRDIIFIILFGLLIIWFTGSFLANRNHNENNDNEINTELVSRSYKTIKHANRKNVDIINYQLNYFNSSINTLELNYLVCNAYVNDGNDEYYLYNNLSLTYDLNTNSFTYCEFEIEFSEDTGNNYFLDNYVPTNFVNYLNTYNTNDNATIDTFTTYDEIGIYCENEDGNVIFENYFAFTGDTFGTLQYFGERFGVSDIIFEVQTIKNLINAKFNDGKAVGENIGYNNGYDNGYDEGYEVGYQEGNSSGYNNGYSEGQTVGYNNGYSEGQTVGYNNGYQVGYDEGLLSNEGYQQGYDEGYDIGHNRGYDQGLSVGLVQGYDNGFIDGQKDTVNEKGFKTLFNAIMNAPYNIFKGILNFEFLGVNLFSLFSFIFTTMLILWIVKIFKK